MKRRYLTTEEMAAIVAFNNAAPVKNLGQGACSVIEAQAHVDAALKFVAKGA